MAKSQDPEPVKPEGEGEAPQPPPARLPAPAAFVASLAADPKEVPEMVVLTGYLGAAPEENNARLYLSPDLSFHVELAREDVLYVQPVPPSQDPLGAVQVWVRKGAQ